jgi:hypothetical protein
MQTVCPNENLSPTTHCHNPEKQSAEKIVKLDWRVPEKCSVDAK